MISLRRIFEGRSGMIFHALSSILVFFIWRITGMPSPGVLGRLVPLSWLITASVYGKGGIPRLSGYLLAAFILFSLFWTLDPGFEVIAAAIGLLGIFPGLLALSSRRFGIQLALLPLIPIILLLVPFTGDEPHFASITERLISSRTGRFTEFSSQMGDPGGGITHHQSFYPALLIPGYPLSVPGIRGMNLLYAMAALMFMSKLFRDSGYKNWKQLTVFGFLLIPGSSILGLVYPGWLALAVFLGGVCAYLRSKNAAWIIAAAMTLVLIKFRFIGLSIGLLAALLIESKGRKRVFLSVAFVCLVAGGLLFDLLILNGRIFWVRYGNIAFIKVIILQPLYRTPEVLLAAGSSLIDIESGLLPKAPWVLAGLAGLHMLKTSSRKMFVWLGLPALCYFLILVFWNPNEWSGMPTPSGRMLLPLLPVLLASLGLIMKRKGVRILVWVSLGISALLFTHPVLRFNTADGTDSLMGRVLGHFSNLTELLPSAVRLDIAIFAGFMILAVIIIVLLKVRSRYTEYTIASAFLLLCVFGGLESNSYEAEDIPAEYRNYCTIYPDESDLELRKFWFFSREKMLMLSRKDDAVILPIPRNTGDSLELTVFYRSLSSGAESGIEVSSGEWSDSVYATSELMETPRWVRIMRDTQLPLMPENLQSIQSHFIIPSADCGDSIRITALGLDNRHGRFHGIYLDRILIR
ncbi:hypothetical protein DRQ25_09705 [Candidatus Fermentibacteria bacterium]|nr:MAG: hypothetical protein DRQ25_09705 [Candidatus Fermentibacteria bacterium]